MNFNIDKIAKDLVPENDLERKNRSLKVWSLWLQFDEDEPAVAVENISIGDRLNISWTGPGETSEIIFTDPKTKRTFRLFGKMND